MHEGNGGCFDVSTRKTIRRSSKGYTTPNLVSRDFFWDGHDWRTSSIDMATSDCTKSSTILYVCVAQLEATLWHNCAFGILGMASNLRWGICHGPFGVIRGSTYALVLDLVADEVKVLSYWCDQVYRLILEGLTSLEFIIRIWLSLGLEGWGDGLLDLGEVEKQQILG